MPRRETQISEGRQSPVVESQSIAPETITASERSTSFPEAGAGVADTGEVAVQPLGRRRGEASSAGAVAKRAKAELESITGLDADRVSAVQHQQDGWHVIVDLIELRRIPAATDVLAEYEAVLGPAGDLLSYRRTRRYFRDQMIEES